MANKQVWAIAEELAAHLPELPQPWGIEKLCEALEQTRGRPLRLHPVDLPALPSGVWYDDGACDFILYRSSAAGYYRDHIILHEICHMLAGHGVPPEELAGRARSADSAAGPRPDGQACNAAEEELAETFASVVLKIAGQRRPRKVSAVERRAEELLGAAGA